MLKKNRCLLVSLVMVGCVLMAFVDAILSPTYEIKSFIKLILFLSIPIGYKLFDKEFSIFKLFTFKKKSFFLSLLLGIGVYVLILGAYFVLGPFFDFSKVTAALQKNIGVNKDNFIFVALYISFINSLLEEFFFRGFAFLTLSRQAGRRFSYVFSASVFSLYHVAIMKSWFPPFFFVLLILSLFIAGLFFNWLDEKNDSIYASWFVHMLANFSINTVGFILFGLL